MMNYTKEKLDIIVVAGQSNAEGNGISTDEQIETRNDVFELVDANLYWFDFSGPGDPILKITLPVQSKVQCLQERMGENGPCYDFSIPFVDLYKSSKYYDKNRKIMVVKAAVGGTGFFKKEWGLNNFLYKRLIDMVDKALSFNTENRIVAYLWHQGECDAFENHGQPLEEKKAYYHDVFMEQTNDFLNRYKQFKFPVIMGEFVNEWSDLEPNYHKTRCVEAALRDCAKELGNSLVVSSEGLLSNNQVLHNGDDIHFSKPALKELGKRYFEAFDQLVKTIK